jgi:hypothetical protein
MRPGPHVRSTEMIKGRVEEVDQCAVCLETYPCNHLRQQARIKELEAEVASLRSSLAGSGQAELQRSIIEGETT